MHTKIFLLFITICNATNSPKQDIVVDVDEITPLLQNETDANPAQFTNLPPDLMNNVMEFSTKNVQANINILNRQYHQQTHNIVRQSKLDLISQHFRQVIDEGLVSPIQIWNEFIYVGFISSRLQFGDGVYELNDPNSNVRRALQTNACIYVRSSGSLSRLMGCLITKLRDCSKPATAVRNVNHYMAFIFSGNGTLCVSWLHICDREGSVQKIIEVRNNSKNLNYFSSIIQHKVVKINVYIENRNHELQLMHFDAKWYCSRVLWTPRQIVCTIICHLSYYYWIWRFASHGKFLGFGMHIFVVSINVIGLVMAELGRWGMNDSTMDYCFAMGFALFFVLTQLTK